MYQKSLLVHAVKCATLVMAISAIYSLTSVPEAPLIFASNLVILIACFFGLSSGRHRPYSLVKIIYVFTFFFFGVVPLNDLTNNNVYWEASAPVHLDILFVTNILILVGLASFFLGTKVRAPVLNLLPSSIDKELCDSQTVFFFIYIFVGFFIFYLEDFNVYSLIFRGYVSELGLNTAVNLSQPMSLISNHFLRPLPFVLLLIYVHKEGLISASITKDSRGTVGQNRLSWSLVTFYLILAIILVAPTAVARFKVASLYIALLLGFTTYWERPFRMQLSIFGGLLVGLPFLDKFRRFDPEEFSLSLDLGYLNHGHFDAYQNFARAVEIDFVSYGFQLLGALLFFVPRSLWDSKPIGSGHQLAADAGYSFSNIAMPYMAEGYVNFGVLGVAAFMFLLGILLGNIDRIAWRLKRAASHHLFIILYYFMFGMVFFIMRGDLMSSFAYTVGLVMSVYAAVYTLSLLNLRFMRGKRL